MVILKHPVTLMIKPFNRLHLMAVMTLLAAGWPAQAQTNFYWTNSAGTATTPWSTASNWTNGGPVSGGNTTTWLNFSVAGNYSASNDFTGAFALNSLNIGAGAVSLYGNPLVLTNNGVAMPVITNSSGNPVIINNGLALGANATFVASASITLNGVVDGPGSLTKLGAKALTLNGASTLGSVVLDGATGGALVLSNNLTATSLTLQNTSGANATHTNTIANGQTLTVNGPVSAGNLTSIPFVSTIDYFTGGGSLAVSGTATNLYVGSANPSAVAGTPSDTLNLSGLGNFTATINTLGVGYAGGVSQGRSMNGILILATNNTITATNLIAGAGSGQPGYGQLQLGATSTLNISNIWVGGCAFGTYAGEGLVMFNPALTSPGTVTIRGVSGGTSAANLTLNANFTGTGNHHDQVDFTGGILDARFGTVNLANQNANNGIYSAVMAIGQTAGAHADFTGGTLTVGRLTASGSTASTLPASFYIGTTTGTATMTAGTIVLSDSGANTFTLPLPLAGTFTVGTNATVTVNNTLYMGKKGNGVTNACATLNLNAGGTLVIPAGGIVTTNTYSGANTITTNSITFDGGTLRASSSGTLIAGNNASISILSGGATFDTGVYSVTNALNLAAATGNGLAGIVVTNGGSGYITAPYVKITDATGSGASAFAKLNAAGRVTNIVVTSRGQNYTSPTITFVGVANGSGVGATGVVASVVGGGLTKLGSGTLTLSGTNTYAGATMISNGALRVNGVISTSAITVASGAVLGGSGTIGGAVTVNAGGLIQPTSAGASGGALTFSGTTGPVYATNSTLAIRAPSSLLDMIALSSASAVFDCGNLDLVIDTTGLSGDVFGVAIVRVANPSGGISGIFHSVTANNGYTVTVHYNAQSIAVDLETPHWPRLAITAVNGGGSPSAGVGFSVVVQARDTNNLPVAVASNSAVALSLSTGTGTLGGATNGIISAGASSVTFTGVVYTRAESDVVLGASGPAFYPGNSAGFTVNAGAAAAIAVISGANQTGGVRRALASPFVVRVTDACSNRVTGAAVTFAAAGYPDGAVGQSLNPVTATTDGNGLASSTLTLGSKPGTYTVVASAGALTPVTFTATAMTRVLVLGGSQAYTQQGLLVEGAFSPAGVASNLQAILSGDSALQPALVQCADTFHTHASAWLMGRTLMSWFYWPDDHAANLDLLRGGWDYVVIMDDPYVASTFPEYSLEGVQAVSAEVRKGGSQPVLVMEWSDAGTAVETFEEMAYRVGDGAGVPVAPAGLAWTNVDPALHDSGARPTPNGAYVTAATVYSQLFKRSARVTGYVPAGLSQGNRDILADAAFDAVQMAATNTHYTGTHLGATRFASPLNPKRYLEITDWASSTESGVYGGLGSVLTLARIGYYRYATPYTYPYSIGHVVDLNQDRYWNDANTNFWNNHCSYDYMEDSGFFTMRYGVDRVIWPDPASPWEQETGAGNESFWSDYYDNGNNLNPGRAVDNGGFFIPNRVFWSRILTAHPEIPPQPDGHHMSALVNCGLASMMYTLLSGRCAVGSEPADPTSLEWQSWFCRKTGYEIAWQYATLNSRVPGFEVLPRTSTAKSVTPLSSETMTVRFLYPPQSPVTVNLACDQPGAAIVTPTLAFTTNNYAVAQTVTLRGLPGPANSQPFNITLATVSGDKVFNGLTDSWAYATTRSTTQATTLNTLPDGAVTTTHDTPVSVSLGVSGAASGNTVFMGPVHGVLAWAGANLVYTPVTAYSGGDSFAFSVTNAGAVTMGSIQIAVSQYPSLVNAGAVNITTHSADLTAVLTSTNNDNFAVWACWGPVDGTTNAVGKWSNTTFVGWFTNVSSLVVTNPGSISTNLPGLAPCYYTFYATNGAGTVWAMPSASFAPYGPPSVSNGNGAGGIGRAHAVLNGQVAANSPATLANIYWGTQDGGTNAAAWAHCYSNGITASGNYSAPLAGLGNGITYYYRCYAANDHGSTWAGATTNFTTVGNSALCQLRLSFTNYNRVEALTNFPVLVVLSDNRGGSGFNYQGFLSAKGYDLRFTDASGAGNLNYEIEQWNTNGNSTVWVQVPVFTNGCSIRAQWGDPADCSQLACTTNGATWDSRFSGVWHLTGLGDSTSNGNNGVGYRTATTDGLVGGCCAWTNYAAYITVPDSPSVSITNSITLEAWINSPNWASATYFPFSKGTSSPSYNTNMYSCSLGSTSVGLECLGDAGVVDSSASYAALSINAWHYVAVRSDLAAGKVTFYMDGAQVGAPQNATNTSMNTTSLPLYMGSAYHGAFGTWMLDEMRITSGARSTNWLWACYQNQASNSVFTTYGAMTVSSTLSINNGIGATNVTATSASVTGVLTATGAAPVQVWVYWGTSDGGSVKSAWQEHCYFGTNMAAVPAPYATQVMGLLPGQSYYYRFYASNAFGDSWASTLSAFLTAADGSGAILIPAAWKVTYFNSSANPDADANADPDHDGMPNWAEYLTGTDPTNLASVFRVTNVGTTPFQGIVVRWPSLTNRFYDLMRATDLMTGSNGFAVMPGASNLSATPPENSYTDTVLGVGPYYYKISVHQ